MTLVRWDPFQELDSLHNRFDTVLGGAGLHSAQTASSQPTPWIPNVDIVENESDLVVRAELAGVDPKQVDLSVEANVLTITGERKSIDDPGEHYHRRERSYGPFTRSFALPRTIDAGKINAAYKDGILTIRLPKHEMAKPKRIEISS